MRHGYNNTTLKQVNSCPSGAFKKEPIPKKKLQNRSNLQVLLKNFYDFRSIVHFEHLLLDQIINDECYLFVLVHLNDAGSRKGPILRSSNSWILYDDNASSHWALITLNYLNKNQVNTINQPLLSPDLAPFDFSLFHSSNHLFREIKL